MMWEVGMRVRVDLGSEALYFISEDEIEESEGVSPGVTLDYSKDGRVVGIEILREASQGVDRDEVERGNEGKDMQAIGRI